VQFGSIMSGQAQGTIKMGRSIVVQATWDPEASVWVATSEDIPLVTEAPSMDALMAKLPGLLQDLLEDLDLEDGEEMDVPFEVVAHIRESVRIRSRAA
jgi:Domain of unknown function (DUF1902)